MTSHFLCSFRPLCGNLSGREAIAAGNLPSYIDGSCRREPDFQATPPSISALCRSSKFAPRLWPGDYVVYITNQHFFDKEAGWALVAILQVKERFNSHEAAAGWYCKNGFSIPSNCIVPGNPPQPYHLTNRIIPADVVDRIGSDAPPEHVIRLWDAIYARRAHICGVFLACEAVFLELQQPPILRRVDLLSIFGRIPGTQNPPKITPDEFRSLSVFAKTAA